MDRDVALVTTLWKHLEAGDLDAALGLVGPEATWRPLGSTCALEGRAGLRRYFRELRAAGGGMTGQAYGVERRGEHVIVRGLIRHSGPGRFSETQGHWVHRVRDGALVSCIGVASAYDADAVVAA